MISLIVGEIVHRSFGDVKIPMSNVDTKHIDAFLASLTISVCHIPACTAARRVPVHDSRYGTNVGEVFQAAKGCEAASDEAVHAIRASNSGQAGTVIVKGSIPTESSSKYNAREGDEGGEELHIRITKRTSFLLGDLVGEIRYCLS